MAFSRDASGTLHRLAPAADGANATLYYGVCPGACETPGSWQQVPLFTSGAVHGHSILINGSGRIHILFQDGSSAALYYGTCSSACQTVGGWQITHIILSDHGSDGYDAARIVQESDGSLLVTTTSYTGSGYGLMLGGCVSNCANAANWEYAALAPDGRYPALAIDASGRHHLLFHRQGDSQLVYGSCSSACLAPASWQLLPIGPSITSTQIALLTTASGVHALFNAGHQITYFTCASSCESASAWTAAVIDDVAGGDRAVALAQSGDFRLHAFYSDHHTANELKYASCTTDCASGPGWVSGVIATGMDVRNTSVVIDAAGAPIAVSDDYGANRLVIVR